MLLELTNHLPQWEEWKRRLQSMPSKIAPRSYLHSPILKCTTSTARHGIGTNQILESNICEWNNEGSLMCILFKTQLQATGWHKSIPRQKKVERIWECKISRESEIKGQEDINGQNPTSGDFTPNPPQGDTNPPPKERLKTMQVNIKGIKK